MSKARKSWQEKLADSKDLPKVVEINDKMSKRWGIGTMVSPAPKVVDEIMKKVPHGKLITMSEVRAVLARKHGATIGGRKNIRQAISFHIEGLVKDGLTLPKSASFTEYVEV